MKPCIAVHIRVKGSELAHTIEHECIDAGVLLEDWDDNGEDELRQVAPLREQSEGALVACGLSDCILDVLQFGIHFWRPSDLLQDLHNASDRAPYQKLQKQCRTILFCTCN
jgi:hypothetical protein